MYQVSSNRAAITADATASGQEKDIRRCCRATAATPSQVLRCAAKLTIMLYRCELAAAAAAAPVPSAPAAVTLFSVLNDCPGSTIENGIITGVLSDAPKSPSPPPPSPTAPLVTIPTLGNVTGYLNTAGTVATYLSVPYASNPVRFSPPIDSPPFPAGAHDGTVALPPCIQGDGVSGVEFDCLRLDINVPTNTSAMPVGGWPVREKTGS